MEKFSAARKGAIRPRGTANPALAMALIGAGLLLLGIAAMAMLPMLLPVDGSPAGVEKSYFSAVPVMVDYPAPVLKLADLDGNSVGLDDLSGSVVLVNHWATWCPPCKAEMPVLQSFYDDYRGHNFTLVAIDAGESQEQVEAYAAGVGLSFPVWVDPTQKAMDAFGTTYLPSSFVISPEGRVVMAWNGAISREMLDRYLTPYLEKINENNG